MLNEKLSFQSSKQFCYGKKNEPLERHLGQVGPLFWVKNGAISLCICQAETSIQRGGLGALLCGQCEQERRDGFPIHCLLCFLPESGSDFAVPAKCCCCFWGMCVLMKQRITGQVFHWELKGLPECFWGRQVPPSGTRAGEINVLSFSWNPPGHF